MRDTVSKSGDPCEASAWLHAPLQRGGRLKSAIKGVFSRLPGGPPPLSLGTHIYRHFLSEVAACRAESGTHRVQIGHWSYSLTASPPPLQLSPAAVKEIAARVTVIPDLYSSNAQVNKACGIIMRQMHAARNLIAEIGVAGLPWEGGWNLFQPTP